MQKHKKKSLSVIPAQAGIHDYLPVACLYAWIPAFAGMTGQMRLE